MKIWTRATHTRQCGLCSSTIFRGEPLLVMTTPEVEREFLRCQTCEGPVPADLPPLVERADVALVKLGALDTLTRIRRLMPQLPLDYKAQAAGEREPGEDG